MCLCCFITMPCFSWLRGINCQRLPGSQHTARLPPWSLSSWKPMKSSSKSAWALYFNKPSTIYFPSFPLAGTDCCWLRHREGPGCTTCWLPPSGWWDAHTRRPPTQGAWAHAQEGNQRRHLHGTHFLSLSMLPLSSYNPNVYNPPYKHLYSNSFLMMDPSSWAVW